MTLGAGLAQSWDRWPPINEARVRFPDLASYVGWVFFSGYSGLYAELNVSRAQVEEWPFTNEAALA